MPLIPEWLLESGVQTLVEWAVSGIIAIGAAALAASLVGRGALRIGVHEGRTRQSPEVFVVGVLSGLVAGACLAWGLLDPASLREPGAATAWLLLIAGFTLGFIVSVVYAQHRWEWDETGLVWRGAFRTTSVRWADLVRSGKSWDGQFFARDKCGRMIRWTTYTLEHQALSKAVAVALGSAPTRSPLRRL